MKIALRADGAQPFINSALLEIGEHAVRAHEVKQYNVQVEAGGLPERGRISFSCCCCSASSLANLLAPPCSTNLVVLAAME